MNINWYPGHMEKTLRKMEENLKKVEMIIELLDARAPKSTKNPIIEELGKNKEKILILNKVDLSDPVETKKCEAYYKSKGYYVIPLNSTNPKEVKKLEVTIAKIAKDRIEKDKKRGIENRRIRAMIVGVPNVGKSTLINTLSGRKGAAIGNRPGITKSLQWINQGNNLQLLDTPGVLWPKFKSEKIGLNLAFIGSIKDEILDSETLALRLVERILELYPELLKERYKVDNLSKEPLEIMEDIGKRRGCIISGGEIDYTRTSEIILDEFRKGIIGRISLESCED